MEGGLCGGAVDGRRPRRIAAYRCRRWILRATPPWRLGRARPAHPTSELLVYIYIFDLLLCYHSELATRPVQPRLEARCLCRALLLPPSSICFKLQKNTYMPPAVFGFFTNPSLTM